MKRVSKDLLQNKKNKKLGSSVWIYILSIYLGTGHFYTEEGPGIILNNI